VESLRGGGPNRGTWEIKAVCNREKKRVGGGTGGTAENSKGGPKKEADQSITTTKVITDREEVPVDLIFSEKKAKRCKGRKKAGEAKKHPGAVVQKTREVTTTKRRNKRAALVRANHAKGWGGSLGVDRGGGHYMEPQFVPPRGLVQDGRNT